MTLLHTAYFMKRLIFLRRAFQQPPTIHPFSFYPPTLRRFPGANPNLTAKQHHGLTTTLLHTSHLNDPTPSRWRLFRVPTQLTPLLLHLSKSPKLLLCSSRSITDIISTMTIPSATSFTSPPTPEAISRPTRASGLPSPNLLSPPR